MYTGAGKAVEMEETYSFVYDGLEASNVFAGIGKKELILAMLAGIVADDSFAGCLVYEGEAPQADGANVCVATRGPGADRLQQRLVEVFERRGIPVLQVFEGGPEVRLAIARADGGLWAAP